MEIFDYDNILLLPRKCRVESRAECDAGVTLGGRRFRLPVVPANMKTVLNEEIAEWLARNGYFYVMHRFDLDNVAFAKAMRDKGLYVSISSGVKQADRDTIDRLAAEGVGADYITIDIAHGHADSVRKTIEHIKKKLPQTFVIAGNVATPEAVIDLAFHTAREQLPTGELVYNDYMSWEPDHANHCNAVLRLLEGFRRRNVPVDALGIQSHIEMILLAVRSPSCAAKSLGPTLEVKMVGSSSL